MQERNREPETSSLRRWAVAVSLAVLSLAIAACTGPSKTAPEAAPTPMAMAPAVSAQGTLAPESAGTASPIGHVSAPAAGGVFASVSAGGSHTCGVRPDGTVLC